MINLVSSASLHKTKQKIKTYHYNYENMQIFVLSMLGVHNK